MVTWEKWRLRVGFDQVEGLTLHQIGFEDGGRLRPIVYRASIAEMVVPYGDPSPLRFWQNYFDAGEYSLGKEANSLALGCDCLGEIHYFDAVVADDDGNPRKIDNAICMHEEDYGLLWKHTDPYNKSSSVRRQRRLVVSSLHHRRQLRLRLLLVPLPRRDHRVRVQGDRSGLRFGLPRDDRRRDVPVGESDRPGIAAPYHQHLLSARLDMMVDGVGNAVDEVEANESRWGRAIPTATGSPEGHTAAPRVRGQRLADGSVGRVWHIVNPHVRNASGNRWRTPCSQRAATLMADPGSSIARRAAFTTKHLFVTAQADSERYPSGQFVNQNPGNTGIDTWMRADATSTAPTSWCGTPSA